MEDDWGFPVKPANLRKKYIKTGHSIEDIYERIIAGIGGTPMPSFKGVIEDDEIWDVVAYVLYLRGEESGLYKDKLPLEPITEDDL